MKEIMYKDLYVKFNIGAPLFGFLALLLIGMIFALVPAISHSKINKLGVSAAGPCFFNIQNGANEHDYDNYSGYSVVVEKVYNYKNESEKDEKLPKTMVVNGHEYILR